METTLHLERLPRTLELIQVEGRIALRFVDQRLLPDRLEFIVTSDWKAVVQAIKSLAVRGAPAIGVAGAAAVALWVSQYASDSHIGAQSPNCFDNQLSCVAGEIAQARPTAVNLSWGVQRAVDAALQYLNGSIVCASDLSKHLYALVKEMETTDEQTNRAIGKNGAELLASNSCILTHCNAGSLATVFYGTALGVVYAAAEQGKIARVYADETRPVGQGSRLTVWELAQVGLPVTLLCDDMAAYAMQNEHIDAVIVGADRIAANGDVANKIGTLGLAILARDFGIPFYVAAPLSTFDMHIACGADILIEQRESAEILVHPVDGVDVLNPAFDVTPASYISKIITETGVYEPVELARARVQ